MLHHKLGEMFGDGQEGHYPLLQGCLTTLFQHAKLGKQSMHPTPPRLGVFMQCMSHIAVYSGLALLPAYHVPGILLKILL